ncbi:MAG TPA: hypothetical protein VGB15_15915 [Longimicrobium sp.]|jgi:hypothetical protein
MHKRSYAEAKAYYQRHRLAAYTRVRVALADAFPELRLAEIDARALAARRRQWTEAHPSGSGGWDWETLAEKYRRDPAAFTLALWSGDLLCGLAVGSASQRRTTGERAAVSVHFVESIPRRMHPMKGDVGLIATTAVAAYGTAIGATHVRLANPLEGAVHLYVALGFRIVRRHGRIVYCEREIGS